MAKYLRGEWVRNRRSGAIGEIVTASEDPGIPYYVVSVDLYDGARPDRLNRALRTWAEPELEAVNRPADVLTYGMTPERLALAFGSFIDRAFRRIVNEGRQYSNGDSQQFEDMPLEQLFQMSLEELEDLAVYAGMLHIRIQRLMAAHADREGLAK